MEIILLYDIVLPKLFVSCPNLLKSYMYFVLFQEISTIRPCVYVYTLHSDEVVSLLISGCEIVVYSCSPMAVVLLLHIDLY